MRGHERVKKGDGVQQKDKRQLAQTYRQEIQLKYKQTNKNTVKVVKHWLAWVAKKGCEVSMLRYIQDANEFYLEQPTLTWILLLIRNFQESLLNDFKVSASF